MATQTIEILPTITENGWSFYTKCRCGGLLKYKFRNENHKGLELEWWCKNSLFCIMRGKRTEVAVTRIDKLEETLKAL
jgi:hypothetical protein